MRSTYLYRLDEGLSYLETKRPAEGDRDRRSRIAYRRGESEKLGDRDRERSRFNL